MDSLYVLIKRNEKADPVDTVEAVFDEVGLPSRWRNLFMGLVINEAKRVYRVTAKTAEKRVNEPVPVNNDGQVHASSMTPTERRHSYLTARFATGDGRYVTWGEATVEDHRLRIGLLQELRNGVNDTIDRHGKAIDQITAAGVSCLNDVPERALEAA